MGGTYVVTIDVVEVIVVACAVTVVVTVRG